MRKLIYIFFIPFIFACSSANQETETDNKILGVSKSSIKLSEEQIDLAKIKTGKFEKMKISETIVCTGVTAIPPEQIASISPIIEGFVKSINYYVGQKVEKGAVLASLQHPGFIQMQKEYMDAKSQMDYFEQEYKRQGELTVENAASIKKMQKAKADYLGAEANYKSLKSTLELLGINVSKIENGDFEKEFKLLAPISGTISVLNANIGKFVSPDICIYEIINNNNLYVNLNVFEKDVSNLHLGHAINFNTLNNTKQFETVVHNIGVKIDPDNRTILVQAKFQNKEAALKPGMHINASIKIKDQEVYSLPADAIAEDQVASYIFVKVNNEFEKHKITKGIEQNGFVEILNLDSNLIESEIVMKGSYYLMSAFELVE